MANLESLSALLQDYGPFRAVYSGRGDLALGGGSICQFRVAQTASGSCLFACRLGGDHPFLFNGEPEAYELSFDGLTREGFRVTVPESPWTPVSSTRVFSAHSQTQALFLIRSFRVEKTPGAVRLHRFLLTNLDPGPRGRIEAAVTWRGEPARVMLEGVEGHQAILKRVSHSRSVAVTATLSLEHGTAEPEALVDSICYILSLAQGRKIQWVGLQGVAEEDGRVAWEESFARSTKRYGVLSMIQPFQADDYVQQVFSRYISVRGPWDLDRLIDAYCDAKSDEDFLESRGVKLVVVLEMLKAQHIEMSDPQKGFILPPRSFARMKKDLRAAIDDVGNNHEIDHSKLSAMKEKVAELNRRSLRRVLATMCSDLGIQMDSSTLKRIMMIRNNLIHNGRYSLSSRDRRRLENVEFYQSLLNFLDISFLSLLEYRGEHWDWLQKKSVTMP